MGDDEISIGDMVTWCTRCGRECNIQGVCGNLYCQQAAAAEPDSRGVVVGVDRDAGSLTVTARWFAEPLRARARPREALGVPMEEWLPPGFVVPTHKHDGLVVRGQRYPRRRKLWRGMNAGQSVVVLQVMGQRWRQLENWGDVVGDADCWIGLADPEPLGSR